MYRRRPLRAVLMPPLVVIVLVGEACGGDTARQSTAPPPVARVAAAPIVEGSLDEIVVAYGTVIPAPGAKQVLNVPFATLVGAALVSPGEDVEPGQVLLRLQPSPEARLSIQQAQEALLAEKQLFESMGRRLELGLAVQDDLSRQRQTLANARARNTEVQKWLETTELRAPAKGVVQSVMAVEAALVPAGAPLLIMTVQSRFELRLGVEPEDTWAVRPGQPVAYSVPGRDRGGSRRAIVRSVSRQVGTNTRLVEVMATPQPHPDGLLLGEFVRGAITVRQAEGLVVPRTALMPQHDEWVLFTVASGVARRHTVQLGVETETKVEVLGEGLQAGDLVIVEGNPVINDGDRVSVAESPAKPASIDETAPSFTPNQ